MLPDLFEVDQRIFQPPAYCCHAPKSGTLELLALEKRLGVFEQTDVVARNGLNEIFSPIEIPKGNVKVVGIVERIQEILVYKV